MLPTNLTGLIELLLAPASVGIIVSWLAERWPWFQKLSSQWKLATFVILAFAMAGSAGVLQIVVNDLPGTEVELLNTAYIAILTLASGLIAPQMFHQYFNQANKEVQQLAERLRKLGYSGGLVSGAELLAVLAKALEEMVNQREGDDDGGPPSEPLGIPAEPVLN